MNWICGAKLADERAAANFEAEATEQDRLASALSLIGTTATLYWKQGYLNQLIALNQQSLSYTQHSLQIAQTHYQSGANGKLDVTSRTKRRQPASDT